MSHELTTRQNGETEFFYAGKVPWHGLGKAVDKLQKSEDAIGKANQKYLDNYDKADTLADKLNDSIKEVKKQLKGLGISQVPDEVEVGEIAVDSFSGQIKNAMNDLMR